MEQNFENKLDFNARLVNFFKSNKKKNILSYFFNNNNNFFFIFSQFT